MQLLDGKRLESRWSPCVRWSWAHPCCLLTSSQLGWLNPHTRMGSTQARWACWTPTSRFNLPSSFIFIKRHLFVRQLTLPKHNHCDSLFFVFFPVNRFNEFQRRFLCYFVSQLWFPVFKLCSPCSHSLSAESAEHQHWIFVYEHTGLPVSTASLLTAWEWSITSPDML